MLDEEAVSVRVTTSLRLTGPRCTVQFRHIADCKGRLPRVDHHKVTRLMPVFDTSRISSGKLVCADLSQVHPAPPGVLSTQRDVGRLTADVSGFKQIALSVAGQRLKQRRACCCT